MRLFGNREDHRWQAVDRAVAPLELRAFHHLGNLLKEDRPLFSHDQRHFAEVGKHLGRVGSQPPQHPNRPLLLTLDRKPAAGVDVARPQSCLDHRQRHAIFQQGGRIDLNLVLLAIASLDEDLCDAGNFQQPPPDDPVSGRPQPHRSCDR